MTRALAIILSLSVLGIAAAVLLPKVSNKPADQIVQTTPTPLPPTPPQTKTQEPSPLPISVPATPPPPAPTPPPTPNPNPQNPPPPTPIQPPPPPPQQQSFSVTADDNIATPAVINVAKGAIVNLTINVSTQNVYYNGLEYKSSVVNSGTIMPGASKTLTFTANQSFTLLSYWPASGVRKTSDITINVQ